MSIYKSSHYFRPAHAAVHFLLHKKSALGISNKNSKTFLHKSVRTDDVYSSMCKRTKYVDLKSIFTFKSRYKANTDDQPLYPLGDEPVETSLLAHCSEMAKITNTQETVHLETTIKCALSQQRMIQKRIGRIRTARHLEFP